MHQPSRIVIKSEIYHGKPCISGTRIPVHLILEMLEYGLTFDDILKEYPQIDIDDIKACIQYAITLIID